ncbi:cupin domain-containing protein [Microbacterium deminutum]|uniref:Cupin domain-containing protein n=1 Tax=Microbacterium deminutum TaxID=344164 RepID=A0ABP5D220_9MICO
MSPLDLPHIPRRVITGVRKGKAVFLDDSATPNAHVYEHIPGMVNSVVYRTAAPAVLPAIENETAPPRSPLLPDEGGTSLVVVTFPPDSVFGTPGLDFAAADKEQYDFAPDFAERFDKNAPGKHQTDSIDYDIVLDGEIWLELDDETKHLRAGDIVIQGAARHAWRNKGDRPATMCFVLIHVSAVDIQSPTKDPS